MMKKKDSQKGFAMLFTVLIVSIILSISIGISNITFKQNILSSIAKDSQIAFFTADSGIECGLIHDLNTSQFAKGVTSVPSTLSCGDMTFNYDASASSQDNFVYVEDVSNQNNPCRVIIFDKTDASINSVKSRGYNICKQTPRQVERALEARFENNTIQTLIVKKLKEAIVLGESYKTTKSGSYNGICNLQTGNSNMPEIQVLINDIRSYGANIRCYTISAVLTVDWGLAVMFDSKRIVTSPVGGVLEIDSSNSGTSDWNSAKSTCEANGKSLLGMSSLIAMYYLGHLSDFTGVYHWTNTEINQNNAGIILNANTGSSSKTLSRVFRCGTPL